MLSHEWQGLVKIEQLGPVTASLCLIGQALVAKAWRQEAIDFQRVQYDDLFNSDTE